jgi:hypothetical protein
VLSRFGHSLRGQDYWLLTRRATVGDICAPLLTQ